MKPDCPQCRLPNVHPMTMPDDWGGLDGCRACVGVGRHHDLNGGTHECLNCRGTGVRVLTQADARQPFPVTDDADDAPDGAVVNLDDGRGWYRRSGDTWYPTDPQEASDGIPTP